MLKQLIIVSALVAIVSGCCACDVRYECLVDSKDDITEIPAGYGCPKECSGDKVIWKHPHGKCVCVDNPCEKKVCIEANTRCVLSKVCPNDTIPYSCYSLAVCK